MVGLGAAIAVFGFGFCSAALAAEPRWLEPVAISNLPAVRVTSIGLGYDGNGNATAVWSGLRDTAEWGPNDYVVQHARRRRGATLERPQTIFSNDEAVGIGEVDLFVGAGGSGAVTWTLMDSGGRPSPTYVQYSLLSADGAFSRPAIVAEDYGGRVGLDAAGHPVVLWQNALEEAYDPHLPTSRRIEALTGGHDRPQILSDGERWASAPRLSTDNAGRSEAIWMLDDGRVQVARHPGVGAFEATETIAPAGTGRFGAVDVVVDRRGNALAAWSAGDHIEAAYRPRGGAFGPPERVSGNPVEGTARHVRLAVDAAGNATLAFHWHAADRYCCGRVMVATRPSIGPFGPAEPLSRTQRHGHGTHGLREEMEPEVSANERGDVVVAWTHSRARVSGSASALSATYRRAGSESFAPLRRLTNRASPYVTPSVAVAPSGNALVGWSGTGAMVATLDVSGQVDRTAPSVSALTARRHGRRQPRLRLGYELSEPANVAVYVAPAGLSPERRRAATRRRFLKSGSGRNRAELPASVFSLPGARRYRVVLRASDEYGNVASSAAAVTPRPSAPAR